MIATALLILFSIALLAGLVHRLAPRASGVLLAAYPAALAIAVLATAHRVEPIREVYPWVPSLGLELAFFVDGLSKLFALLVCGVGSIVLVYAGAYLKGHEHLGRMYILLMLFMASMLGIVISDNLILLFVFWELTSITSYLLIGFNHTSKVSRDSALQALLVTGGGGLALLAGMLLLGSAGGTLSISALIEGSGTVRSHPLYTAGVGLVLLGAFTKSAQVPFHFWLPNAMAAPTPVSAYLHSSTMVKAGVFLLARLTPVLGGTLLWTASVATAGGLTAVVGAWLAFRSRELKRLLAYSTISALGVMVLLIGLGTQPALIAAVVFLLAHAFYKGALFLVVGTIDHETGERDIRKLGGLARAMPYTASAAVLAGLSMAGVPPLVGFVGKELALEAAGAAGYGWTAFAAVVLTGTLLVAVAAMTISPFLGVRPERLAHVHEGSPGLWGGALLLALLGVGAAILPAGVTPLLSAAASATAGEPIEVKLALWHGLTPALFASVAALFVGGALFRGRDMLPQDWGRLPAAATPSGWYAGGLAFLSRIAAWQTAAIQTGLLRHYLLLTIGVTVGLAGAALLLRHAVIPAMSWTDIRAHEAGLTLVMFLAALGAMHSRSRFASVAALGVIGYSIALIFAMFGALDLALTQLLVETLTVILLVLVLYNLPSTRLPVMNIRWRDLLITGSAGLLMTLIVLAAGTSAGPEPISGYFIERAVPDGHGRNVVNVILVDFRALDTLGEIAVLGIAATGVYALLRLRPEKEARP